MKKNLGLILGTAVLSILTVVPAFAGEWHHEGGTSIYDAERSWYRRDDGTYPANTWERLEGDWGESWYCFDGAGYVIKNAWVGNYYCGSIGYMLTDSFIDGYYVGDDGAWIPATPDRTEDLYKKYGMYGAAPAMDGITYNGVYEIADFNADGILDMMLAESMGECDFEPTPTSYSIASYTIEGGRIVKKDEYTGSGYNCSLPSATQIRKLDGQLHFTKDFGNYNLSQVKDPGWSVGTYAQHSVIETE